MNGRERETCCNVCVGKNAEMENYLVGCDGQKIYIGK